jgi:hypothetical protein
LKQKGGARRLSQMLQKVKEKSGFAHSWLCDEGHESAPALNPIEQGRQSFKMRGTKVQKMGIGSNSEWLLA